MDELSVKYTDLEDLYKRQKGLVKVETKVSWSPDGEIHTANVLKNVVGNISPFEFKLFHPELEVGGRFRPYKFIVEECQQLDSDRKAYAVRSLCNTGLLLREFMIVEPNYTNGRIPSEVAYVAFNSSPAMLPDVNITPLTITP